MVKKTDIIAIVGPTATGKSSLSIELAKRLNGEIISADSRQIYKEFDIATAKTLPTEMGGINHYLIDILTPLEDFSAGLFVQMAKNAIDEICRKGKFPIIVGGTGLYLRTLLDNYQMPKGEPNLILRKELEDLALNEGVEAVYNILVGLDGEYAKSVHPNNLSRVIRAIEILKAQSKPMGEARSKEESDYNVKWIGLDAKDRDVLYERINHRVDLMFELGLEREARQIVDKYGFSKLVGNTIGYKEFLPYFSSEISIEKVAEEIKRNTRRYAKRQLTWFRGQQGINWFYVDSLSQEEILEKALKLLIS